MLTLVVNSLGVHINVLSRGVVILELSVLVELVFRLCIL